MPERLLERIEAAVAALPDPTVAKVVPFPVGARSVARQARAPQWFAVAAAVALLGAMAAFFTPGLRDNPAVARAPQETVAGLHMPGHGASGSRTGFVPAGSRAGVREVRDEGLVWPNNGQQPLRRVKVVYFERVTLVNERGEKIEVEKPRVEYILLPEKIH